jgi:thiosulfate dehydrogenase
MSNHQQLHQLYLGTMRSYRTLTAAAFIKQNMPMGHNTQFPLGQGGSLGDQEALDVAEYFAHMARPDFVGKEKDWPNGGKPKDARY